MTEGQKAGERVKKRAKERRKALIVLLGGVCKNPDDNLECTKHKKLEFDHIWGRTWDTRKYNQNTRMKFFELEAEAGLIQLLCRSCNAKKQ